MVPSNNKELVIVTPSLDMKYNPYAWVSNHSLVHEKMNHEWGDKSRDIHQTLGVVHFTDSKSSHIAKSHNNAQLVA